MSQPPKELEDWICLKCNMRVKLPYPHVPIIQDIVCPSCVKNLKIKNPDLSIRKIMKKERGYCGQAKDQNGNEYWFYEMSD